MTTGKRTPRFGEQRAVKNGNRLSARTLYQIFGVPDPANYLHHCYLRRALASLPEFTPSRILDAGSGPGDHAIWLARQFPDAAVIARDIEPHRVAALTESVSKLGIANLAVEVADLRSMEDEGAFDLVVSIDVLEHISEQREVLHRLRRSLRDGGWAFFHIPTVRPRPAPFHRYLGEFLAWGEHEHVAAELTAEAFVQTAQSAGFAVTAVSRTFGFWTGELATSLFALPFRNTPLNRLAQAALMPPCRVLAAADLLNIEHTRYAVAVLATTS